MDTFPANTHKVDPVNKCDVCREVPAEYYNSNWYIHVCSLECFDEFLKRYSIEIDEVAIKVTNANDLKEDEEK